MSSDRSPDPLNDHVLTPHHQPCGAGPTASTLPMREAGPPGIKEGGLLSRQEVWLRHCIPAAHAAARSSASVKDAEKKAPLGGRADGYGQTRAVRRPLRKNSFLAAAAPRGSRPIFFCNRKTPVKSTLDIFFEFQKQRETSFFLKNSTDEPPGLHLLQEISRMLLFL